MDNINQITYRCNGVDYSEEEFIERIFENLAERHFASCDYIAKRMVTDSKSVKVALENGIIRICKAYKEEHNDNIKTRDLCQSLYIDSAIIEGLIADGRLIEMVNASDLEETKRNTLAEKKETARIAKLEAFKNQVDGLNKEPIVDARRHSIYEGAKFHYGSFGKK